MAFNLTEHVYVPVLSGPAFKPRLEGLETGIIFSFTIDASSTGDQAALALHRPKVRPPQGESRISRFSHKGLRNEVNVTAWYPGASTDRYGRENKESPEVLHADGSVRWCVNAGTCKHLEISAAALIVPCYLDTG